MINNNIEVFLGLGSNIGRREENIERAMGLLNLAVTIVVCSSVYETEPVGYKQQPLFLNMVCKCKTDLIPEQLLTTVKDIEKKLGRRPSFRNAPRIIDIDILFYGDKIINAPDLVIPHPRLAERAFALIPLAEIGKDFIHPVLSKTAAELLVQVAGKESVRFWGKIQGK